MQSSLHYNSVVAHNLGPLKRQKISHSVYSHHVGSQSLMMPLHAVGANKADTVRLVYFFFLLFAIKNFRICLLSSMNDMPAL